MSSAPEEYIYGFGLWVKSFQYYCAEYRETASISGELNETFKYLRLTLSFRY